MNVYQTRTFPLQVPGNQGFVTELTDFPKIIITELASGNMGELSQVPRVSFVEATDIVWHNRESCAVTLMTDVTKSVHQNCRFTARKTDIEPAWLKLSQFVYVLSNLTDVEQVCGAEKPRSPFEAPCVLCLIRLSCDCFLRHRPSSVGRNPTSHHDQRIIAPKPVCKSNNTVPTSVLHTVNLALLQNFYDLTNETISGRDLFRASEPIEPKPLNLQLFSDNTNRLLSADKESSYSCQQFAK